jgi:peptidoglycan/xylan/chitin deacetylase (PgdA/CDA1 family)
MASLNVFITVDTECWPRQPDWRETGLRDDARREIFGDTPQGEFGIGYQMRLLNSYGLKAVFFVESLFACGAAAERLREIVSAIQAEGHEVQLHIHSEWLTWIEQSPLPTRTGQNMKDFTEEEQAVLVGVALANLREAGAKGVCAFRAGNYGADFNTLRALSRNGIRCDTSYNAAYLGSDCGLRTSECLLQPTELLGVCEFPITWFRDYPGHLRHAQLCACSFAEMRGALLQAWRQGWYSFVLVSHSFELLKRRKRPGVAPLPDQTVVKRFELLCEFLAANRDKFTTRGFTELNERDIPLEVPARPLRSTISRTAGRLAEQLMRRTMR